MGQTPEVRAAEMGSATPQSAVAGTAEAKVVSPPHAEAIKVTTPDTMAGKVAGPVSMSDGDEFRLAQNGVMVIKQKPSAAAFCQMR